MKDRATDLSATERSPTRLPPDSQAGVLASSAPLQTEDVERRIQGIWAEVLGTSLPALEQDFFELGGESVQAVELFARLSGAFQTSLNASLVFEARTIRAQTDLLLDGRISVSDFTSLVAVQPRGARPPLFFIHTHDGTITYCRKFPKHLGADQPVYGLQAQALAGHPPHRSIEEMASQYIREMRRVHRDGPYHLFGYCSGGLIAFEVAQQLLRDGHCVGLLGMFNTPAPGFLTVSLPRRLRYWRQRMQLELRRLRHGGARNRLAYVAGKVGKLRQRFQQRLDPGAKGAVRRTPLEGTEQQILWEAASGDDGLITSALKQYRAASAFPARVTFFSTVELNYFFALPPVEVWRAFAAPDLEVVELPASGAGALSDSLVQAIAARLRQSVDECLGSGRAAAG
ncbi:MAG TPA: thioesterase domain-containing protein [Candidatus Acidoferrum sp.]|nr:thioesterase domain-containing protein [Candidatus Acidoferrum sp.]